MIASSGARDALLVIVGAGASHDAAPSVAGDHQTPPLTKDLAYPSAHAMKLSERYKECQPLLAELRRALKPPSNPPGLAEESTTIEDALRLYIGRRETDPHISKHVAAMRFYLRDLMWETAGFVHGHDGGVTNYTSLVARTYGWAAEHGSHVCFVSFNYDPLLEWACEAHFGLEPDDLNSYTADPTASVLKPHGSVLWYWPYIYRNPAMAEYPRWAKAIRAGEPKEPLATPIHAAGSPTDDASWGGEWLPTLPALALPIAGKSTFVWPPEQREFIDGFRRGAFSRVLTIGWRAAEPHFLDLIRPKVANDARVLAITGGNQKVASNEAGAVLDAIAPERPMRQTAVEGFKASLDQGTLDWIFA